jgi:hypothetical protein
VHLRCPSEKPRQPPDASCLKNSCDVRHAGKRPFLDSAWPSLRPPQLLHRLFGGSGSVGDTVPLLRPPGALLANPQSSSHDFLPMTPQQFISKWQRVQLSERSASQQHFLDLCELLEQPKPAAADPDGTFYTFERGVHKTGGGDGWADVWMRGHFAWEYKGKHKDLAAQVATWSTSAQPAAGMRFDLPSSRPIARLFENTLRLRVAIARLSSTVTPEHSCRVSASITPHPATNSPTYSTSATETASSSFARSK